MSNNNNICPHENIDILKVVNRGDHVRLEVLCNDCKKIGEDVYEVDTCSILFEDPIVGKDKEEEEVNNRLWN